MRILVFDDEGPLVEAICDDLSVAGFVCASAGGATGAIALLDREPFDVVLTDISLSGEGDSAGLDIVSHIRDGRPSHVVIMTAHDAEHYAGEAVTGRSHSAQADRVSHFAREIDWMDATTT